ncbi:MAG: type II toxin-antitoxin system PemK/MazF family toxin [Clostridia bacterium]|nr:type II toxin-antitoxin system PemK/MazF family toxin [Clostridia bacterium]
MIRAEQGDILRVSGINWPVIVVSNNHFNQIGEAIVCPILNNITQNAVHLPIRVSTSAGELQGHIACEHLRHVDLNVRGNILRKIILDGVLSPIYTTS